MSKDKKASFDSRRAAEALGPVIMRAHRGGALGGFDNDKALTHMAVIVFVTQRLIDNAALITA